MNELDFAEKNEKTMTTKEVAEALNTTKDVVLANARKCLQNKQIEHGKATYWTQKEITILLDYMKSHNSNNRSVEFNSTVENTTTDLTPALKIKKAMELMQEGYEEELQILCAKNLEQAQQLCDFIDFCSPNEAVRTQLKSCLIVLMTGLTDERERQNEQVTSKLRAS